MRRRPIVRVPCFQKSGYEETLAFTARTAWKTSRINGHPEVCARTLVFCVSLRMTREHNNLIIGHHDKSRISPDCYKVLDETQLLRQSQFVIGMLPAVRNSTAAGLAEPRAKIYYAIHSKDGLRNRMSKCVALHFSGFLWPFMSPCQLAEKQICFRICCCSRVPGTRRPA